MRTESVDVCVIGSGAGGALIAHRAALAGKSTLVVERGPYLRGRDMSHDEFDMVARLYKDGGLQMNTSLDMFILQGSCVGGSTVLANNAMFRAEEHVFDEWERLGAVLDRPALSRSYQEIEQTLGAGAPGEETISAGSRLLFQGATSIGLDARYMSKALGACTGCGSCNIGCVFDHKRSSLTTFISWAEAKGARVLANTTVEKIEWKRGRASSLIARQGEEMVRVQARQFVVACGAIGSSALLLKSKIHKNVGTRLSFNAGAACTIEYENPIDTYDGDQMSVYVKGDGFNIEPVHNPPGATALMVPGWFQEHGDLMRRYRNITFAGALVGTEATGRVVQSPFFGHEETRFHMSDKDLSTLKRGIKDIARSFLAAGAKRVILPTHQFKAIESMKDVELVDAAFDSTREIGVGSSHPQGGNPLSNDPSIGVVDDGFAVHGFDNLFVCDASVFPSCIYVNPIETIWALAAYAAPRILARG